MTLAPLFVPPKPVAHNAINDSYIVILKPGAVVADHVFAAQNVHKTTPLNVEGGIRHVYDSSHVKGYSGRFSLQALEQLRAMPEVDYIEQDQIVFASEVSQRSSSRSTLGRVRLMGIAAATPTAQVC